MLLFRVVSKSLTRNVGAGLHARLVSVRNVPMSLTGIAALVNIAAGLTLWMHWAVRLNGCP